MRGANEAFVKSLDDVLACLRQVLIEKNRKYGNSALVPVRIFSKAAPVEQLRVRIDDKLSRLVQGSLDEDEDVELDLLGYLILLRIARQSATATTEPPVQHPKEEKGSAKEEHSRYNSLPYLHGRATGRFWGKEEGRWGMGLAPIKAEWRVEIIDWNDNQRELQLTGDQAGFERVLPQIVSTYPELRDFCLRVDHQQCIPVGEFLDGQVSWSGLYEGEEDE